MPGCLGALEDESCATMAAQRKIATRLQATPKGVGECNFILFGEAILSGAAPVRDSDLCGPESGQGIRSGTGGSRSLQPSANFAASLKMRTNIWRVSLPV